MNAVDHLNPAETLVLGWEEWLSLPGLGLAALKAKIDTGARTSALHAFDIETFGPIERSMVRFSVHPVRARDDVVVHCAARVVDRREVASSNGERELRYVIATPVRIGGREWPIEITLTDRSAMSYRMLLGRSAIRADIVVDPTASFRQPRLSYRSYRGAGRGRQPSRPLTIAIVGDGSEQPSDRTIAREAMRRGHRIEHLDYRVAVPHFASGEALLEIESRTSGHFDAVIARVGRAAGRRGVGVVRQLELMGAFAPNPADALARCSDPLTLTQHLYRQGVPVAPFVGCTPGAATTPRLDGLFILLIAGRMMAALPSNPKSHGCGSTTREHPPGSIEAEVALAQRAARALGLAIAGVHVVSSAHGPLIAAVSTRPPLARFERATGVRATPALLALIEDRVRRPQFEITPPPTISAT